jgi:hypothetical protein
MALLGAVEASEGRPQCEEIRSLEPWALLLFPGHKEVSNRPQPHVPTKMSWAATGPKQQGQGTMDKASETTSQNELSSFQGLPQALVTVTDSRLTHKPALRP